MKSGYVNNMMKISTKTVGVLVVLALLFTISYANAEEWPLKRRIDLSSGFGDYRGNRFHAGVDLRTGGKVGAPVFSPVNGYIWRVRMSYDGYGKGVYVKGYDGRIFVFGHLSALAGRIQREVREAQHDARRYYVDLSFPQNAIPVKAGEQIGLSGQTGSGAPHLHFEVRSADNKPLNPLANGFTLSDKVHPTFETLVLQLTDDHSLTDDGTRTVSLPAHKLKRPGQYTVDSVICMDSPFGILTHCFDQMKAGGMRQSIYRLTLSIDEKPYYESVFDRLDFSYGRSAQLEFDQVCAADGNKRVRRLYHRAGNAYPGSKALNDHDGLVGEDAYLKFGRHRGLIVAEDIYGNTSQLRFQFFWSPPGGAYVLDTLLPVQESSLAFDAFFRPAEGVETAGLDSVWVESYDGTEWIRGNVAHLEDGWLKVRREDSRSWRLVAAIDGVRVANGTWPSGELRKASSEVDFDISPGGVIVSTESPATFVSLLSETFGIETPIARAEVFDDRVHAFVAPSSGLTYISDGFLLAAVGYNKAESLVVDDRLTIRTGRAGFHEPRFISAEKVELPGRTNPMPISSVYRILPEAFVTRDNFEISLTLDSATEKAGLCWWDEKEKNWVWINQDSLDSYTARAESQGGGLFAAVVDDDRPRVSKLNIREGMTVTNLKPNVRFLLEDTLSGIADDQSIDVHINDIWLIPEWDFENHQCVARLYEPLEPGPCVLTVKVTDRAGNKTELERRFTVTGKRSKKSGGN